MKNTTRRLAIMAMLTAISVILTYFKFPIFPAAPYLEYETADVPILIGALMFGPLAGLILTVVASALQAMTVSAHSGVIGFLMHVFATGAWAMTSGYIYKKKNSFIGLIISLVAGSLVMIVIMVPLNLIFTPLWGVPLEVVKAGIVPVVIPFNTIKSGLNSLLTFLVFTPIVKFWKH